MKIRLPHAPYIANKIAIDLFNCGFVTMLKGLEPVTKVAEDLILEDIKKEIVLEERVTEILEQNEDEMEFQRVDRRSMFWLIKKKLAHEFNVLLSYEDRYNAIAHEILEMSWKQGLIEYSVSEIASKTSCITLLKITSSIFKPLKTTWPIELPTTNVNWFRDRKSTI